MVSEAGIGDEGVAALRRDGELDIGWDYQECSRLCYHFGP